MNSNQSDVMSPLKTNPRVVSAYKLLNAGVLLAFLVNDLIGQDCWESKSVAFLVNAICFVPYLRLFCKIGHVHSGLRHGVAA